MKREELIAILSNFLKETLRLKTAHIDPQDNLMEKFGLDSMGAVEYVIKMEEEFDIAISDEEVQTVYKNKGIDQLYSHQARAIEHVLEGKNVVVSTPTASGKTLIYNTVTLDALTKNPSSRSLYLFPTKALSQDQLAELFELNKLMGDKLGFSPMMEIHHRIHVKPSARRHRSY